MEIKNPFDLFKTLREISLLTFFVLHSLILDERILQIICLSEANGFADASSLGSNRPP